MHVSSIFGIAVTATLACGSTVAQQQARVIVATPVTQQIPIPQQFCQDQEVITGTQTTGTGAVIGSIIGGIAGNALGKSGRHGYHGYYRPSTRGPSTVIGAIAGGLIGHSIERTNSRPSYETVRYCTNGVTYENRVIGYDVTYEYAGERHTARMDHDPGSWLPINVFPQNQSATPSATTFVGPSGTYRPAPEGVVVTRNISPYPSLTSETADVHQSLSSPRHSRLTPNL